MNADIDRRFPNLREDPFAMAMMCSVLIAKNRYDDAFALGLAAVEAAPGNMEVRDLVSATLARNVPKWHVPMLHDSARNRAYALALRSMITPGVRILEIGTGAGFLSLIAAQAGALVTSCEANPIVASAAREIVRRNGLADRIKIVSKFSTQLTLGEDLDEPADILMSELFDDTLYGDGIVSFIGDAKLRLLAPGAKIIPARSELRCALVAFRIPDKHLPVARVEGFDLSPFNLLAPRTTTHLRSAKIGAVARSAPVSALALDFSESSPFGKTRESVTFVSTGGRVDGVAQWLKIDFGNGVVFENDPFSGAPSHWGSPINPFTTPMSTADGELVDVEVRRVDREVFMNVQPLRGVVGAVNP